MAAVKIIAQNKKARHDYELGKALEAGITLAGSEVKSIKAGNVSIREAYVQIRGGEAWLMNAYVKPYQAKQEHNPDPDRTRKLLLHRSELSSLVGESKANRRTIVPTKIYLKRGTVKVEIALARGKKQHDKRASLKKREQEREAAEAMKQANQ